MKKNSAALVCRESVAQSVHPAWRWTFVFLFHFFFIALPAPTFATYGVHAKPSRLGLLTGSEDHTSSKPRRTILHQSPRKLLTCTSYLVAHTSYIMMRKGRLYICKSVCARTCFSLEGCLIPACWRTRIRYYRTIDTMIVCTLVLFT